MTARFKVWCSTTELTMVGCGRHSLLQNPITERTCSDRLSSRTSHRAPLELAESTVLKYLVFQLISRCGGRRRSVPDISDRLKVSHVTHNRKPLNFLHVLCNQCQAFVQFSIGIGSVGAKRCISTPVGISTWRRSPSKSKPSASGLQSLRDIRRPVP